MTCPQKWKMDQKNQYSFRAYGRIAIARSLKVILPLTTAITSVSEYRLKDIYMHHKFGDQPMHRSFGKGSMHKKPSMFAEQLNCQYVCTRRDTPMYIKGSRINSFKQQRDRQRILLRLFTLICYTYQRRCILQQ